MSKFGEWLAKEIERQKLTLKAVSEMAQCNYSYLWKMIKYKQNPSREKALAIGKALNAPVQALRAAGYIPYPEREDAEWEQYLAGVQSLLYWLREAGVYDEAETGLLAGIFSSYVALHFDPKTQNSRRSLEKELRETLMVEIPKIIQEISSVREVSGPLSPSFLELSGFSFHARISLPKHSEQIGKFKDVLVDDPSKAASSPVFPFFFTHLLHLTEVPDFVEVCSPLSLLPLAILRPIAPSHVASDIAQYVWARERFPDDTPLHRYRKELGRYNDRFERNLSSELEKDSFWLRAKGEVDHLWKALQISFEFLESPLQFYEVMHLFRRTHEKDDGVFVFSITSGLYDPRQHEGDLPLEHEMDEVWRSEKKPYRRIDPYRIVYFRDGIERGCRTGCLVHYQLDKAQTARALKEGLDRAKKKKRYYKDRARQVLARFLMLPNLEISYGDFLKPFSSFDWRYWLTLTNERYVVLSIRQDPTREIRHGFLIDRRLFDEVLLSVESLWPEEVKRYIGESTSYVTALAKYLYYSGMLGGPVKRTDEVYSEEEANKKAEDLLRELAGPVWDKE